MKKNLFLGLALVVIILTCVAFRTQRECPPLQAGEVAGVLSPEGYTILEVDYPCDWREPPVLVVSPTGQGSLWVARFEGNSLTGAVGSVAVQGEPGREVEFSWVAVGP